MAEPLRGLLSLDLLLDLVLSWFVPTHRAAQRQGCKLPADCVKVKGIPLRQFY